MNNCKAQKVDCPLNCGQQMYNLSALRVHFHLSCPLVKTISRSCKTARIKMVTDNQVTEIIIDGLRSMVARHLSPLAYMTYFRLGLIRYPDEATDYLNISSTFSSWTELSCGGFYQGQINKNGIPDGKGIWIRDGGLKIGHTKNGKLHGGCL